MDAAEIENFFMTKSEEKGMINKKGAQISWFC
jgi:hypothetical protein